MKRKMLIFYLLLNGSIDALAARDPILDFPLENPPVIASNWNPDTGCPSLGGVYSLTGEVFSTQEKNNKQIVVEKVTAYIVDWHPRGSEVDLRGIIRHESYPVVNAKKFLIEELPKGFRVVRQWSDDNLSTLEFSMERGDYQCEHGWITFPPRKASGSTEGAAYSIYSEVNITRLENGGIMYKQIYRSSRRDFLFFQRSINTISFFVFQHTE